MSYCRFSKDSDVYLYRDLADRIICCACRLAPKYKIGMHKDKIFKTECGALNHLGAHQKAGHKVVKYAAKRLEKELKNCKLDI